MFNLVERGQPPDYLEKSFNFKDFRKIFGKSEGFGENFGKSEGFGENFGKSGGFGENFGKSGGFGEIFGKSEGFGEIFGKSEGFGENFGKSEGFGEIFGKSEGLNQEWIVRTNNSFFAIVSIKLKNYLQKKECIQAGNNRPRREPDNNPLVSLQAEDKGLPAVVATVGLIPRG